MKIKIDYREKTSGIVELFEKENISIEVGKVSYGDYVINERIVIERKTAEDFLVSIIDGRLFRQISSIKKCCASPVLLIEGNPYNTDHNFNSAAIRGALISVQVIWCVPVVFSKSKEDTKNIILMIGNQEEKYIDILPLRSGWRPKRLKSKQLYILQGLPRIGAVLAKRLLEHFKTVSRVMCATVEELAEVDGIGKLSATAIREVLDSEVEGLTSLKR